MSSSKRSLVTGLFTLLTVATLSFIPAHTALADGPGGTGGGTTDGSQLTENVYEEINMKGTQQIPPAELEKLAGPTLDRLATQLPDYANLLREGLTDIKWYTDTKTFNPAVCDDQSMFKLHQTIRACQDRDSIRISKSFYDSNPKLLPDIIVHELVVHASQIFPVNEDVMRVSAAVRDPNLSAEQLQKIVSRIVPEQLTMTASQKLAAALMTAKQKQAALASIQKVVCPLVPGSVNTDEASALGDAMGKIQSDLMEGPYQGGMLFAPWTSDALLELGLTNRVIDDGANAIEGGQTLDNYDALQAQIKSMQSRYGCPSDGSLDARADSITMSKPGSPQQSGAPALSAGSAAGSTR